MTDFEEGGKCRLNRKQDARLSPAYFSPNYKYFDQLLQTLKNKTTVLNLVFKGFLRTSVPPLISKFYAKEFYILSRFSVENFCLYQKISHEILLGFRNFPVSKNFIDKKGVITIFRRIFLSHSTETFRRGTLLVSQNFWYGKIFGIKGGWVGISRFSVEYFCLTVPKHFVEETFCAVF